MMRDEFVRRRQWLTDAEFVDLLGATNLIPGPNSTEMAIHIGARRAGWPGLVVAGAAFILPATAIVTVLAWIYARTGSTPQAAALLYGIKPVIIAIVAHALWALVRATLARRLLLAVAAVGLVLYLAGAGEIALLVGAGVATVLARRLAGAGLWLAAGAASAATPTLAAAAPATTAAISSIFLVFLKIGSVLYGSGYVLLAFLRSDLVERLGWLTEAQVLDAVAIGQFTPGPVFTTATFIGYLIAGLPGAAAATAGIFLPAFVFVAASVPLLPRLRRSPIVGAFLDGVGAASLALMAGVTIRLAGAAIVDVPTALMAAAALVLLVRTRVNSAWLVLGGAAAGVAVRALG
jgi:chromate transporter